MQKVPAQISHRKLLLWQKRMQKIWVWRNGQNLWKVIHFQHRIFGKKGGKEGGKYDILISNPPYIATEEIETLMEEVRLHDPRGALDGREDGLYFYRNITAEAGKYLRPGGWLLYEIGCTQGAAVSGMMKTAGFEQVQVIKDLPGLDRVVIGQKPL